ncbi:Unknown protein, partial [Striga hermonthica]
QQPPPPPSPPHQSVPNQADDHLNVVLQFRRLTPPAFVGVGGPTAVAELIRQLEQNFDLLQCIDVQKVICGRCQLNGDAAMWWSDYWRLRPGELANLTWERMNEVVLEKYYPQSYRISMEREFWDLRQGTGTVEEYEQSFTRMSAFAPHLVDTELKKATKFRDGLHPTLRMHLTIHGNLLYGETVILAIQLES